MGTNYYIRKLPPKEKKEDLKKLIDINDFKNIREQVSQIYGSFCPLNMEDELMGEIHLGKRSGGWKFLWNPNIYQIRNGHTEWEDHNGIRTGHWVSESDTAYYVYPLTKEGIKAFIDRPDIEIYDEYEEKQDKEEFWNMAINWTIWEDHETGEVKEAWDADSYDKEFPNERKFSSRNEYTDFLESLGYKLSVCKQDFYADGLRFATTTDFS